MPCPGVSDFALDGRLGDAGLPRGQERQLEQYARAAYFLQDALNKAQQELQRYRQYAMMLEGQLSNTSHAPAAGTPGGVYGQARKEESAKQRKTSAATARRTLRDPQTLPKAKEAETTPAVVVRPEAGAAASEARAARATAEMRVEAGEDMAQVINNFEKMLDEAKRHLAQNELQEAKNAADSLLDKMFAIFYRHRLNQKTAEVNQISAGAREIRRIASRRIYEEKAGKMAAVPEEDEAGAAAPEEDEAARRAATGAATGGSAARAATGRAAAGAAPVTGHETEEVEALNRAQGEICNSINVSEHTLDCFQSAQQFARDIGLVNGNIQKMRAYVQKEYKARARVTHPDRAGQDVGFSAVNKANKNLKDALDAWSETDQHEKFETWLSNEIARCEGQLKTSRVTYASIEAKLEHTLAKQAVAEGRWNDALKYAHNTIDRCSAWKKMRTSRVSDPELKLIQTEAEDIIKSAEKAVRERI